MNENDYKRMMNQTVPRAALIRETKLKMMNMKTEEKYMRKPVLKAAVIVFAALLLSTTAFAAVWHLLTPSEVAEQMSGPVLSEAFAGEGAININETQRAGGFIFTLMSVVSGDFVEDYEDPRLFIDTGMLRDRTYAVIAIAREDGEPMDLLENTFSFRPYIRGIMPWHFSFSGGGGMTIIDGVKYAIIEFDDVTLFADRGIYIGISSNWDWRDAFIFEETGVSVNPDYDGVSVLFELPLDPALADPVKAQQILDEFFGEPWSPEAVDRIRREAGEADGEVVFEERVELIPDTSESGSSEAVERETAAGERSARLHDLFLPWHDAVPVAATIQVLTVDADGYINFSYNYENGEGSVRVLFRDVFPIPHIMGDINEAIFTTWRTETPTGIIHSAVRFTIDEQGVLSGAVVELSG